MLPSNVTPAFQQLVLTYYALPIEYPHLKQVTVAQWAKESGWGNSGLAKDGLNYAGMKWRPYMSEFGAISFPYKAWDGVDDYGAFNKQEDFIRAFWRRFDIIPAYKGWRKHSGTPESFIRRIGPSWVGGGQKEWDSYIDGILEIKEQRIDPVFKNLDRLKP
jgi:hypothetical protein